MGGLSVGSVDTVSTGTVAGGAVEVSLTYTRQDGGTEDEVRRIAVEESGDGYVIAEDEAIG